MAILDTSLPSVAAGTGPFTRQDMGRGGGVSAFPKGGAGLFGIPTQSPEEEIRAVEAHEYLHLATGQFIPELDMLHKIALDLGVADPAIQAVMDDFVHCVGKKIPEIAPYLENLKLAPSPEELMSAVHRMTDAERLLLKVRSASVDSLRDTMTETLDTLQVEDLNTIEERLRSTTISSDRKIDDVRDECTAETKQRYAGISSMTDTIHAYDTAAAETTMLRPEDVGTARSRVLSDLTDALRACPKGEEADIDAIMEQFTGSSIGNMKTIRFLIQAMNYATKGIESIERFKEDSEKHMTETLADLAVPEDKSLLKAKARDTDALVDTMYRRALADAISGGMGSPSIGKWGEMQIYEMPFTETIAMKVARRHIRYGFDGPFRYPHRIHPAGDGSCFGHRRKIRGGTLLIDMSGSMSLYAGDIKEIITLLPAATVAGYSGARSGVMTEGRLIVLAHGGKMVDLTRARDQLGSGNIVDGPALRWLRTQKKPHIWVCDGVVTGIGDGVYSNLTSEAMQEVVTQKIIWLTDIASVEEYVKQHKGMFLS